MFRALDKIYKSDRRKKEIRDKRDKYMFALLEEIATDIASVRFEISLFEGEYKGSLDSAEYIMLYEDEKRYETDEWLITISEKFAGWFFNTYKKLIDKPLSFSDVEYLYVKDYAFKNKEVFIA